MKQVKAKPMQLLNAFLKCRLFRVERENHAIRSFKKQNPSFIALFYQNQITFITLNSVIPSTTAADFPLNYFNNCR
ncbi:MAG: hypothetical protein CVU06_04320 [Bacteroidetes bacterium HGW-Bacteroidetes-22]|nr:MAG: hypothetical protein CVU06_04320 [Bacteroidetes bacterium HGW-Bacteroidetes-22]